MFWLCVDRIVPFIIFRFDFVLFAIVNRLLFLYNLPHLLTLVTRYDHEKRATRSTGSTSLACIPEVLDDASAPQQATGNLSWADLLVESRFHRLSFSCPSLHSRLTGSLPRRMPGSVIVLHFQHSYWHHHKDSNRFSLKLNAFVPNQLIDNRPQTPVTVYPTLDHLLSCWL